MKMILIVKQRNKKELKVFAKEYRIKRKNEKEKVNNIHAILGLSMYMKTVMK
jgi:hypothetical protein